MHKRTERLGPIPNKHYNNLRGASELCTRDISCTPVARYVSLSYRISTPLCGYHWIPIRAITSARVKGIAWAYLLRAIVCVWAHVHVCIAEYLSVFVHMRVGAFVLKDRPLRQKNN